MTKYVHKGLVIEAVVCAGRGALDGACNMRVLNFVHVRREILFEVVTVLTEMKVVYKACHVITFCYICQIASFAHRQNDVALLRAQGLDNHRLIVFFCISGKDFGKRFKLRPSLVKREAFGYTLGSPRAENDYFYGDCIGMKTGFTRQAEYCLMSAFKCGGKTLVIGAFGYEDEYQRYRDINKLAKACKDLLK